MELDIEGLFRLPETMVALLEGPLLAGESLSRRSPSFGAHVSNHQTYVRTALNQPYSLLQRDCATPVWVAKQTTTISSSKAIPVRARYVATFDFWSWLIPSRILVRGILLQRQQGGRHLQHGQRPHHVKNQRTYASRAHAQC
jgi:hypothetical protein